MNWKEIKISPDWTHFLYREKVLFGRTFKSVLKFKGRGLAPVEDAQGWSIIDTNGEIVIPGPFASAWGFYEGLCAVEDGAGWYHIKESGLVAYQDRYAWCGNFQEGVCPVRDKGGHYFHIRSCGSRLYEENYRYCGDFKDGYACVMLSSGCFQHINSQGQLFYESAFKELGIYHKGYATARDEVGWFHIDLNGCPLYAERFALLEPFYNGAALATSFAGEKMVLFSPPLCNYAML